MVFSYGVYETLSVVFRHVVEHAHKSLDTVQNLEFLLASVMFRVTCEPENRDSWNDEHRILRLFDVFNHVVGFILHNVA